jgi:lipoprotein-anchoring transpeptidase ErfK/SrfK
MRNVIKVTKLLLLVSASSILGACATTHTQGSGYASSGPSNESYAARMPSSIQTSERTIVVDPRLHAWAAYDSSGQMVKGGNASAGSNWCGDIGRPCHTRVGTFRIQSMGGPDCKSHIFPVGVGGAPMPYCMFFSGGQALHGVPSSEVGEGNFSHGCVRMHVSDAEWIRYDFANVGTKVIVKSY